MSTKLYVGNLPFSVTDQQLNEHFAQAGTVVSASIITDRATGRPRGFGFVEYEDDATAQKAIEMFHGKDFMGRDLVVNEAREKRERRPGGFNDRRGGFNR